MHQEYPNTPEEAFVASGNTFFNKERLVEQIALAPEPITVEKGVLPEKLYNYYLDGVLKIYELPKEYICYVIAADVAEGKNNDSSSANGINNKTAKPAFGFNVRNTNAGGIGLMYHDPARSIAFCHNSGLASSPCSMNTPFVSRPRKDFSSGSCGLLSAVK